MIHAIDDAFYVAGPAFAVVSPAHLRSAAPPTDGGGAYHRLVPRPRVRTLSPIGWTSVAFAFLDFVMA